LGPFATASRRTPHCHSPGVATVARRMRIDVTTTTTTTTTPTRDRGDRYGPIECLYGSSVRTSLTMTLLVAVMVQVQLSTARSK